MQNPGALILHRLCQAFVALTGTLGGAETSFDPIDVLNPEHRARTCSLGPRLFQHDFVAHQTAVPFMERALLWPFEHAA
jgi:hypothetical protein